MGFIVLCCDRLVLHPHPAASDTIRVIACGSARLNLAP